jgi:CDP-glycerol glycerophosphotransferase
METAIADGGMRVLPVDISEFAAVEVDFETDLARANSLLPGEPLNEVAEVS